MASVLAELSSAANIEWWHASSQLPQYGKLDDIAAMAVLATLSVLYLLWGILWDRSDPYRYKMYERPQERLTNCTSKNTRNIAQKLEQIVSTAQ